MARIAIIPGDGIGVETVREAVAVLEACDEAFRLGLELIHEDLGADRFLRDGITISEEEFDRLAACDAVLLGALGDPRVPGNEHARDILLGLRFRLDLYVNFRPCVSLSPERGPLKGDPRLDLVIFRENTEGEYSGAGGGIRLGSAHEVAIENNVSTRSGVERIVRAAFEHAAEEGRARVTMVDKANALSSVGGLWRTTFAEVAEEFPSVDHEAMFVDAVAMDLVRRPERYQVIVTSNLFGDILSDLAAELAGGLGLAPSGNIHPARHGVFEPVHGSAPDIAGRGVANPIGAIRSAGLLLEFLGFEAASRAVEDAAAHCVRDGPRTPDLGGEASTGDVGAWVCGTISERTTRATTTTG